jgi:uncharacterized protein (TIGR02246 family)
MRKSTMLGLVSVTAATAAGSPALSDVMEDIEAAQAAWEDAFNAGDAAAAAEAVFAEDARLLPPDGPVVEGREAIAAFWQGLMDAGVHSLDLGLIAVEVQGDAMIETGTWSVTAPNPEGGEVTLEGKALVIWKQGEDGVWRMAQDMWNDDS